MHINSLFACSHSEAMKGSSFLRLLIWSRLLASSVWTQLPLTDPTWGPGPLTSKMATLFTGSVHTPLLGSRTRKISCYCSFNPTLPGVSVTYFAWVRKYLASFPRTLYGAKPATDWNVIERCSFGNLPATVRCMIPYRKSERARTRHPPPPALWMAQDRQLIGMLAGTAKRRGGAHRGKFLPRPGVIGATDWHRGPTFDVKSLKMYVKTSFFDFEHEVKKD
jgi:hypothetical protein